MTTAYHAIRYRTCVHCGKPIRRLNRRWWSEKIIDGHLHREEACPAAGLPGHYPKEEK